MANYGGSAATGQQPMVSGLFKDKHSAERAYDLIVDRGYTREETSVVMSEETHKRHFQRRGADTELGNKALEGVGVGGAIGATVGGLFGALAAIGTSVALPGLGIVVAGPLIAALSGAGAGGVAGGLIGALVGSGIPEERARHYEAGIKGGGILISVAPRTADDAQWIEREWRNLGGDLATH